MRRMNIRNKRAGWWLFSLDWGIRDFWDGVDGDGFAGDRYCGGRFDWDGDVSIAFQNIKFTSREYPQMFPTLGELFGFLHFPLYVERSSPVVEAPCIWNSQRLWRSFQFLQSPTAIHTLTTIRPNFSNFNWSWPTFHFHTKRVGNKMVLTQMELMLIALNVFFLKTP